MARTAAQPPRPRGPSGRVGPSATRSEPYAQALCTVLLADPDGAGAEALEDHWRYSEVALITCVDGATALFLAGRLAPDLVIVSAQLPLVSTPVVIATIRNDLPGPILLSVGAGVGEGDADTLGEALAAGATEIIQRPYTQRDTLNRIEAHVRRIASRRASDTAVSLAGIELDPARYEARVDGKPLPLTPREFRILHYLVANYARTVSPRDIERAVWDGPGESASSNAIAVHMRRIRRHLGQAATISNIRGVGYRFNLPPAR